MAPPSEQDFEVLGRRVVASLGSMPDLNHAAADVAEQERFNPDQIRRLIEYANTEAFLKQLHGGAGEESGTPPVTPPNPVGEFEPAQAGTVIHIILSRGGNVPGDMASTDFGEDVTSTFPDSALKEPKLAPGAPETEAPIEESSEAAEPEDEEPRDEEPEGKDAKKPFPKKLEKREAAHRALDRVLGQIVDRRHQERFAFDAKAAVLVDLVRRRPALFAAIEKVAYNLYADQPVALAILSNLRVNLRQPPLTEDEVCIKQAGAPRVFEAIPELSTIDELVEHARSAVRYQRAEEYLRDRLH